jgi:hypothetical protein
LHLAQVSQFEGDLNFFRTTRLTVPWFPASLIAKSSV